MEHQEIDAFIDDHIIYHKEHKFTKNALNARQEDIK